MRRIAAAIEKPARWFFATTGMPVPGVAKRARRRLVGASGEVPRSLPDEVDALRLRVERLEARAYLDGIGRPPE